MKEKQCRPDCLPRLVCQGGRTTVPELDQPLMVVVVLVVLARASADAKAAGAVSKTNGWAANISLNSSAMVLAAVQHNGF